MSLAGLVREIFQNSPPLAHLNLESFGGSHTAGEIILEALLNSSICTIQDLNIG